MIIIISERKEPIHHPQICRPFRNSRKTVGGSPRDCSKTVELEEKGFSGYHPICSGCVSDYRHLVLGIIFGKSGGVGFVCFRVD